MESDPLQKLREDLASLHRHLHHRDRIIADQNRRLVQLQLQIEKLTAEVRRLRGKDTPPPEPPEPPAAVEPPPEPPPPTPPHRPDRGKGKGNTGKRDGRRKGGKRAALPPALPRHVVDIALGSCARCQETDWDVIGQKISEKGDIIPAQVVVEQQRRAVGRCRCCRHLQTAPLPEQAVPKGKVTNRFLSWLLVQRFVHHLPLYRLREELTRRGLPQAEGTIHGELGVLAKLVRPLVEDCMKRELLANFIVHGDGTGLKVVKKGGTDLGCLRVFCSDTATIFRFHPTKESPGIHDLLKGFTHNLVHDAEAAAKVVYREEMVTECGCNAHGLRKFRDATPSDERAQAGVAWIGTWYDVEKEGRAKGLTGAAMTRWRQAEIGPYVNDFKKWLDTLYPTLTPKSPLRVAMGYYKRNWKALTRFLTDERIPLDNNRAEREMQQIALNRKAILFCGSEGGAKRFALFASLVRTCLQLRVDPQAYLEWLFGRLGSWPRKRLGELTPAAYARGQPQALRQAA